MTSEVDRTHDVRRQSWVASATGHADFPIQNLPYGIFTHGGRSGAVGIAIGEEILDLAAAIDAGLLDGQALSAATRSIGSTLNRYMALSPADRGALRRALSDLLANDTESGARASLVRDDILVPQSACGMLMPAQVGDYTDFFAGIHHARNAGRKMRSAEDPLWPNYLHVPIAYHGRSSSIDISGSTVARPNGQVLNSGDAAPALMPCQALDYEFELGAWIGTGNARGDHIPIENAGRHIAGFCLLNDWSARDIQMWEAQPLGPFLAKNFATTVSPWVITIEALAPFFTAVPPRPQGYPEPLAYLRDDDDQRTGALDIVLEAFLATDRTRATGAAPHRLSRANTLDLYWTFAQMVAHHTVGGCTLRPGDLFGSGTISAETRNGFGSLMELSAFGTDPVALDGETRTFLQDGDEVILKGRCVAEGFASIGFGDCRGRVTATPIATRAARSPNVSFEEA